MGLLDRSSFWFALGRKNRIRIRKERLSEAFRLTKLFGVFCLSLVLGYWAKENTEGLARRQWLESHVPSATVWKQALKVVGFQTVDNLGVQHRILRTLPLSSDSVPSVWVDQKKQWMVAFPPVGKDFWIVMTRTSNIRSLTPSDTPQNWESVGIGWEGLNAILNLSYPVLQRSPQQGDPREIRY